MRRDLDPVVGEDPQVRLPDPRSDGQRLPGVARRDAVLVGLKRDQRAARRDPVDDDLRGEREQRQWPQRLGCAELTDGAPPSTTTVRRRSR